MKKINLMILTALLITLTACETPEFSSYATAQELDLRDSDRDGVINSRDICTESPGDSVIDERGCAERALVEKKTDFEINFDFDSDKLRPSEFETVIEVKVLIESNPGAQIFLVGDTSPEGSDEYNEDHGRRRADAIIAQLLRQGVPENRIEGFVYYEGPVKRLLQKRERRTIIRVVHRDYEVTQPWSIYRTENQIAE